MTATGSGDPAPPPRRHRENVPLGILCMLGATVMFAGSSAVSKWLVDSYPVGEILFCRGAVSLATTALFVLPSTGLAVLRTQRLGAHVTRSVAQAAAQTLLVLAFSMMPLAGAVAINFSAPLFATVASAVFLKEAVGKARWLALMIGFIGVLVVTNPGADTIQFGALLALGNAVIYGIITAGVRGMTGTKSTETLTMYQMLLLTAIFALTLPFGVRMPTAFDAAIMVINGVCNAFAQYWWTRALHLAPPSATGPFYYFMLVWTILFGYLIWGDVPTASLLIGSAIVVASGLFLLWREQRRQARPR